MKNNNFINIIFIFFLLINLSCSKKKVNASKELHSKNDIITSLNNQDPDTALKIINQQLKENPNDSEMLFYKASAFAMKGGLDLFKIYPLLKMKFFHEAIVNWDDLDKYENPYQKYFKLNFDNIQININKDIKKKLKNLNSDFKKKIKNLSLKDIENYFDIFDKINKKFLKNKYVLSEQQKDYLRKLSLNYKDNRKLFKKLKLRFNEKLLLAKKDYNFYKDKYEYTAKKQINDISTELSEVNDFKIDESTLTKFDVSKSKEEEEEEDNINIAKNNKSKTIDDNENIDNIFDQLIDLQNKTYKTSVAINTIIKNQDTIANQDLDSEKASHIKFDLKFVKDNAMKVIWGIYMSLPLIGLLPKIENKNLDYIDKSLELLNKIIDKHDKFEKKSRHYMSFLSSVSFLIVFKKTLMVDKIIDPLSFVCNFSYKALFASYYRIHNYLNYFMKGAIGIKLSNKYFTKISDFTKTIENDEGDLSDNSKVIVKKSLIKVKKEVCGDN